MAYQKCKNGHAFDDKIHTVCPYCPSAEKDAFAGNFAEGSSDTEETWIGESKEPQLDTEETMVGDIPAASDVSDDKSDRTMYVDPKVNSSPKSAKPKRKLAGWLITYTWDEHGDGYPLFFGKNEIGRLKNNDIVVNDTTMSNHHGTILFRGTDVILNDDLSTSGTFVNNATKSVDKGMLKDNDIIKMGQTLFKIKIIGEIVL
jgi:hypothetical protein